MADVQISAQRRTEFGKGASRRARRAGRTPAVIYGHGIDPIHVTLPEKELFLALRQANALFEIRVEGDSKPVLGLPKQIQRDPILPVVEHVDFILVRAGEKVSVEVPVIITGEAERGSMTNHDLLALPVLAPVNSIPDEIEVSIEGLAIGDSILTGALQLPDGVELDIDPETLVVGIVEPVVESVPEDTEEAEEGEGEEDSEEE